MECNIPRFVILIVLGLISQESFVQSRSVSNCGQLSSLPYNYEAGKSYVYQVELTSYHLRLIEEQRNNGQRDPRIVTHGRAVLTALENCQFVLTLDNFSSDVIGRDSKDQDNTVGSHNVPRSSVKFTLANGKVSDLFIEEKSKPWTTNVLRALLSMIQTKGVAEDGNEIGLKGKCLTSYQNDGRGITIKETSNCQDSSFAMGLVEGVPYETSATVPGSRWGYGLLPSRNRCTQSIQDGMLQSVNCTENTHGGVFGDSKESEATLTLGQYNMNPNEVSGVTTDEISKLIVPTSIVYDPKHNSPDKLWEEEVTTSAINLINSMHANRDENKADLYFQLRETLKLVKNFTQLEKLVEDQQTDPIVTRLKREILREAASEIGTEAAIIYLTKLFKNDEIKLDEALSFYMKLPATHEATVRGLEVLGSNLNDAWAKYQNSDDNDERKQLRRILLGVSGYAHQYCRFTNRDCGTVPEFIRIVNRLAVFTDSRQPDVVSAALLALGNVESLPQPAVNKIKKILRNNQDSTETVRITGFEAFRRDPCQQDLKQVVRQIIVDPSVSTELRIEAYLAATRCLQDKDFKVINKILQDPESSLSSFIASHVYNIQDSQSPSKNHLKGQRPSVGSIKIPENVRSVHNDSFSSRYMEFSWFNKDSNVGFSVGGDMIFQSGTRNLHFARLNITVDFGGKSYNFFEVGASRRLFPTMESMYRAGTTAALMQSLLPALISTDSYFRMYGTTVSMGIDIADVGILRSQVSGFSGLEIAEVGHDSEMRRLELIKSFTLFEKATIFPTLTGLPRTVSVNGLYLPMFSGDQTGSAPARNKVYGITDSGFILKGTAALGKATPIKIEETLEGKVRQNSTLGFETDLNVASKKLVYIVHFTDNVIWSKRTTVDRVFSVEINGKSYGRWSRNRDTSVSVQEGQSKALSGPDCWDDENCWRQLKNRATADEWRRIETYADFEEDGESGLAVYGKRMRVSMLETLGDPSSSSNNQKWPQFDQRSLVDSWSQYNTLFTYELAGLRFSGRRLHTGKFNSDTLYTIEKTEDAFTGYTLEVSFGSDGSGGHGKIIDAKLITNGLSTRDYMNVNVNFTDITAYDCEDNTDRPQTTLLISGDGYLNRKMSQFQFSSSSVGSPLSELDMDYPLPELKSPGILGNPSYGLIHRNKYDATLAVQFGSESYKLLDWKVVNTKTHGKVTLVLGAEGSRLGTLKGLVQVNPEGSQTNQVSRSDGHLSNMKAEMVVDNPVIYHMTNMTIDFDGNDFSFFATTRQKSESTQSWTTEIDGSLPDDPYNGESSFKLNYNDPRNTFNVNVKNDAKSDDSTLNTKLTAVIEGSGSRLLQLFSPPTQIRLECTTNSNIPAEKKAVYDQALKGVINLKFESLNSRQGPSELARITSHFNGGKFLGEDKYTGNVQTSVNAEGKEVGWLDYTFDAISIPDNDNENEIVPQTSAFGQSFNMDSKYKGWLVAKERQLFGGISNVNHTFDATMSSFVNPDETEWIDQGTIRYSKIDADSGRIMASATGNVVKNVTYHNLLDFSSKEVLEILIEGHKVSTIRELKVDGLNIVFLSDQSGPFGSKTLMELTSGIFEANHQHKYNAKVRTQFKQMMLFGGQNGDDEPTTHFNMTISRRR